MSDSTILDMLYAAHKGAYTGSLSNIEVADLIQDAMTEVDALQQSVASFIREFREVYEHSSVTPDNDLCEFAGVYSGDYKPGAF